MSKMYGVSCKIWAGDFENCRANVPSLMIRFRAQKVKKSPPPLTKKIYFYSTEKSL